MNQHFAQMPKTEYLIINLEDKTLAESYMENNEYLCMSKTNNKPQTFYKNY